MAAIVAGLGGCLERTNPFDPANRISPIIPPLREQNHLFIDSLRSVGLSGSQGMDGFLARYREDFLANSQRNDSNQARRELNAARMTSNGAIMTANAAIADPDSLRTLVSYVLLETLVLTEPIGALDTAIARARDAIFGISERMNSVNAVTSPVVVYPLPYVDSVLGPLRDAFATFDSLARRIEAANKAASIANETILIYNDSMIVLNGAVKDYNNGIDFRREAAKKGFVTNAESLYVATKTAAPGDTIFLGPGTLAVDLRFSSGVQGNPIVIRGYPGWKTILRAGTGGSAGGGQAGNLDSTRFVQFEDLVFRGGTNSGIKLTHGSQGVSFHRCLFDSNGTWGIDASDSELNLYDCEIRENGGGIRVAAVANSDAGIELQNVLIVRNRGRGIEAVTPKGLILNSTISDNGANGLHINAHQRSLIVSNSILSGNGGYGIFCEGSFNNQDGLTVQTSDIWGNRVPEDPLDDWSLENLDTALALSMRVSNQSIDPGFIDTAAFDYNLRPGSGLSQNEPNVIIGFRRKR